METEEEKGQRNKEGEGLFEKKKRSWTGREGGGSE